MRPLSRPGRVDGSTSRAGSSTPLGLNGAGRVVLTNSLRLKRAGRVVLTNSLGLNGAGLVVPTNPLGLTAAGRVVLTNPLGLNGDSLARFASSVRRLAPLLALGLFCACPPPSPSLDSGSPVIPQDSCAQGFALSADGVGCEPILPAEPCPPGTRPRLGQVTCEPVGWTSCPQGFEADASGWGCAPILPSTPCTGATRAALGSRTCVPVGDCAAPFPPAGATVFVDPAGPLDSTHYRALQDAVAAAGTGAVIAVEAGTYVESVLFTRDVTVVGRCPEKVLLSGAGAQSAGLRAGRSIQVTVRGLTVVDHAIGAVGARGTLTLEDVVLERNREESFLVGQGEHLAVRRSAVRDTVPDATGYGPAIDASGGAVLELTDVELSGHVGVAIHAYEAATQLAVTRSIVSDTQTIASGVDGRGFDVEDTAHLELHESAVLRNHTWGLFVSGSARVVNSVIADTAVGLGGDNGYGIELRNTGQLELVDSALVNNHDVGLYADGVGCRATVTGSLLRATQRTDSGVGGLGFAMRDDAVLAMSGTAVVANANSAGSFFEDLTGQGAGSLSASLLLGTGGPSGAPAAAGVYVGEGYRVVLDDLSVVGSRGAGVYLEGRVEGAEVVVLDSVPDTDGRNGVGVVVNFGGALRLVRSAVARSRTAGIEVLNLGSTATLVDVVVSGSEPAVDGRFGHAFISEGVPEGGPEVTIEHCRFSGGAARGGLVFAGSRARVSRSLVDHAALGVHVQEGSTLAVVDALPDAGAPLEVDITTDTRFVEVTTRVGAGLLVLPSVEVTKPP